MRSRFLPWLLLAVPLAAAPPVAVAQPRPFTVHDLVAMERISDPRVSPAGDRVVFVRRTTDLAADRGRTDLWLVGSDGRGLRQLTAHPDADGSPRWAPGGDVVYFLSTRSGSSQVWRIAVDGGEARQVTELPLDVGGFALSPDGARLVVALEVFVDCEGVACTAERVAAAGERRSSGRLYDRLFVRHWDVWKDGRRSHLFAVPVAGGEPVDLMRGLEADAPTKPFGGFEEVAFGPGGELVFTARAAGAAEAWSTDFDLWAAPLDGSAPARNLTDDNPAWDTGPVFSPDGRLLAYRAMERAGYESDRYRIVLMDWPGGDRRTLAADWDRSPADLLFSADGGTLYATAADVGNVALFAVEVASGAVRRLTGEGHARSPGLAGERLVIGLDHLRSPVELYSLAGDGGGLEGLTGINDERLAAVSLGEPEQVSFAGWNGETVWAWVVKPVGLDPARRYPVAFIVHGGPQGSADNDFHYRWNPQVYAGAGYAAVMVDFHGSTGYGQAFTDSIQGDWGGKPLEDLQKGLAAVLERYPWMDGERVCALGASYGGYMINWIAGAWPERFRCLVNHDGVFDLRSMYFATEELWFPEWDHGGPYWVNPEGHERHNPALNVERWQTPMLVIHGALDYRVPETQGLAAFTALQRRGVPSRLLFFPDENHWVLRPANSILWHETVLDWLARWLQAPAGGG